MTSEIKTIFYILVGAFYLFYRFYQKEKRKQEARSTGKKPVSSRTSEDIFRELQKSLKLPQQTVEPDFGKPKENKARKPLKRETARVKPTAHKPLVKKHTKHEEDKKPKHHVEPTLAEHMNFDARKAVIYAELLKRPQY